MLNKVKESSSGKVGGVMGSLNGAVLYMNLTLELELDVVVNAWNPSTTEVEAGRAEVEGHP